MEAGRRNRRDSWSICWYTALVNLTWAIDGNVVLDAGSPLIYSASYLFNALAFASVVSWALLRDPKLLTWLVNGVALSVCVQALLIAVTGVGDGTRYSGFFNNPNQLGYFVLSAVTLAIDCRPTSKAAGVAHSRCSSCQQLCWSLLSLSRAATISMAALCFVAVLTSRHRWLVIGSIALASVGIAAAQRSMNEQFLTAIERVVVRAGSFEEKLEVMSEERGYERILRHPWYLVAGAGEGRPSAWVRDHSRSIRHLETWHSRTE